MRLSLLATALLISTSALAQYMSPAGVTRQSYDPVAAAWAHAELERAVQAVRARFDVVVLDSQETASEDTPFQEVWKRIEDLPKATGAVLVAPAGWDRDDWIRASLLTAGVGTLIWKGDGPIRNFIQDNRSERGDKLAWFFEKLGSGKYTFGALAATYGVARAADKDRLADASLDGLQTALIGGALNVITKFVFGRERPYQAGGDPHRFHGPHIPPKYVSFCSGHTTHAFSWATAFAENYPKGIVPYLAYSTATLVGWSRMNDDMHWASDVSCGAATGIGVGSVVSKRTPPTPGSK